MKQKLDYNINWSEHFLLDADSPSGLVKIKINEEIITKKRVGHRHFRKNKPKSWQLPFEGHRYVVHRIIWIMTYGSIDPDLVIDHLDGNPFNNSINNLKLKTQKNNTRNTRLNVKNTSGFSGVYLSTNTRGLKYYVARWNELDGKRKSKLFSVKKLGKFTAKALAVEYREKQIQRLIIEGADYTERHGYDI